MLIDGSAHDRAIVSLLSNHQRADMLRQLSANAEEAKQLAELHGSPVQMLGRMALGDTRRLNIQQTLAEAGPVELEAASRLAIMTGDLAMAAAVVTVVDRRGKDRRPFSAGEFACRGRPACRYLAQAQRCSACL